MKERLKSIAQQLLPISARRRIVQYTRWPPVGFVRLGSLRRLNPISPDWGFDRGLPVDRYYIEQFLTKHTSDIQGHVLEIKNDLYSSRFGGERVTELDILHPEEDNPEATIIADLTCAPHIPDNSYDCIILTQTLHLIYDVRAVLTTLSRILKPGGVLLATVSGISKISRDDMDRWGHSWSFTTYSARSLFQEFFPTKNMEVEAYGNVLTAVASLHGLASQELRRSKLDYYDPDYQVVITIRAVKLELAV